MKLRMPNIAAVAATGTALLGSCCALPLLLAGVGLGSAGFAATLAPFRSYLIGATALLLGGAFSAVYGRNRVCHDAGACDVHNMRRTKLLLWIATAMALLFLIGPSLVARCL